MGRMVKNGENYTRIWMIHWNIALEWSGGEYPGLGHYHLGKAKWFDEILELAEKYGIYIMLCLESFNNLRISQPYPAYDSNPYAKENGGMLQKPEQFFTNPEARRLFKQRLRYLVARYSYSTNILCWEFWNEFKEEWGIYQNVYDQKFRVPVTAGEHTIIVDNKGKDWLSVVGYKLTNYQTYENPTLRVFGLQNDTMALLWLQNTRHTWYRMFEEIPLKAVLPTYIEIKGLQDGEFKVEWWDTYQANKVQSTNAICIDGILQLEAPRIERDIACKIRGE